MNIDFSKMNGLVPAIVQDAISGKVLMQGFMNEEALAKTQETGKVTFFSRSKNRLWTKGETSGNFMELVSMAVDCDGDAILVKANPQGPVCHTGSDTCWNEENSSKTGFIDQLRAIIKDRKNNPSDQSYTASLFAKGINKVAQKVGEEAVEIVIEAKDDNKELFLGEAADLLFHYLVLLEAKGYELDEVMEVLIERHKK
ncbi:MAG TPA: bifunctional phosphoribosyl-AMP cyclohydrolase/phosphoribosyl-ATP diphosphatase [Algoriphagus sp.]|jgi:phosphoribosyl-ATP pyrophosphohydrolase/phosphoribosyl-AMP cyclohydrolase|uniref:bifunctional phosphoribosyl-AMP cyclohydrolase/phosphoribosyl-ATP diphosphatase HisIE n=3 Tax=Algoriphagus TaxID=246875 RepID=UPI000C67F4D8|nr:MULTISPECIES: bifunctional phosphoribosyl-AMP cyclohydrolase/phosphoribosyl-ATP diphosphatase HisIE [unclassified Algoriphagus]MAL12551.1 bifunctional phosphoribosyl-AMP cyclohydrolase/phosphoribosyl-ATP diphosphatase [Algoriphagus sp.]MAN88158.1 bifunctional phosphoribosyl-AMP cyclohydrolase/phosphoribosyl-ATP diphosphatase [Algoriphagus sp.]HAD51032.1 bifunctional phosphoribosyl-AMP cyclohydrolase/phosphoribosyl-ATP diphosphatase [Algoriphagus sp.]HAS57030.1 bifunctional phosphoribosyl-AMP|tara:strand:- start:1927 stop:2523 length:597 start_codon:yes stop_codon:yes gene_type:complete